MILNKKNYLNQIIATIDLGLELTHTFSLKGAFGVPNQL